MTPPTHHPSDDLLLEYALGVGSDAQDLVIATHLTLCPVCRGRVAAMEALGGAALELPVDEVPAPPLNEDDALAAIFAAPSPRSSVREPVSGPAWLPEPLRSRLGPVTDQSWQRLVPGMISEIPIVGERDGAENGRLRLVRMRPGCRIPDHTHGDQELNLVLAGGFDDRGASYLRGDLSVADGEVEHDLRTHRDGACIILQLLDAPIEPRTLFGQMMASLTGET